MALAGAQANQLARDAKCLLDTGSYPTAAALAALSIEESSKSILLRGVLAAESAPALKKAWAAYRNHGDKSVLWRFLAAGLIQTVAGDASGMLIDFSGSVQRYNDFDSGVLNNIKQAGLYTDCVGEEPQWVEPKSMIDKETAERLVVAAQSIAQLFCRPPTTIETALWVKHMAHLIKPDHSETDIGNEMAQWIKGLIDGGFFPVTMPPGLVVK
jgi:AbiV family abortive infection protein